MSPPERISKGSKKVWMAALGLVAIALALLVWTSYDDADNSARATSQVANASDPPAVGGDASGALSSNATLPSGKSASAAALSLFERKVRTMSDPEWRVAVGTWSELHPEIAGLLKDRGVFEAAARAGLSADPEIRFDVLMTRMPSLVRATTVVTATPGTEITTAAPESGPGAAGKN
jgi:hypothetical protein